MHIIDRRRNPRGKSLGNRQRFIRRAREQIREAIKNNLRDRSVKDSSSGEDVVISSDGIHEPRFGRDRTAGQHERIFPGNKEYLEGDRIPKPRGGDGRGNRASEDGEGEDDFAFALTRDEFLDLFFEDLELPDLVKQKIKAEKSPQPQRAGFSITGAPNRLSLVRTMRRSLVRRVALGRPGEDVLAQLERELAGLRDGSIAPSDGRSAEERIAEVETALERARGKRARIPFIDPVDLRYRRYEQVPKPISQAVMFCLMDVSASMDETMKDLAKRFFMLLHMFLDRRYEHVEVVFIRHTNHAQEVDEETFFYGRETGGTVVSSALHEMLRVVAARYPTADWNIYAAQASDGDDVLSDVPRCASLLEERVLPICQYMAYVEIGRDGGPPGFNMQRDSDLWTGYSPVAETHDNFAMRAIGEPRDIYPVFRGLFSREGVEA
ncbi:YeaH/YhbH family protein [Ferruginivarius sediminum]|uniref:UPF0229 protein DRB17_00590 n=1 Tax=Ferruginivarius sediminum TaxID=2661937 RepID=A0A369TGH6_9PROT|nr:YeaH/YhbH family protein [Ferruginivarius sediminum]RDD63714.1 YeaH/YhbH family protein [Ferruginivarius sediminum]